MRWSSTALGGNDTINAAALSADSAKLTIDGGAGNDTILGGRGADTLLGGDGNDFIDGNQGDDTAFMGAGNDTFQWDPGDGSDIVEGQAGTDTMLFNGAGANENDRSLRQRRARCGSPATWPTSRWTRTMWRSSRSTRSAARTTSTSAT